MTLTAIVCCAMTTAVFTSCGGDDTGSSGGGGGEEDKTPYGVEMNYSFTVNDQAVENLTMTIEYYDETGKFQKEVMTSTNWSKKVSVKLPAKLGARLYVAIKDGVTLSDEKQYTFDWKYTVSYKIVNKQGKTLGEVFTNNKHKDLKEKNGSEVENYLAKYAGKALLGYIYDFDANGKTEDTNETGE